MISFCRSTSYYTLMGSLPALPRHFEEADRVPISGLRFGARLKMLKPRDLEVVDEMTDFLAWDRQPLELTDENVLQRYNRFMGKISNQFARDLIQLAMTNRTIIAGLRCRRLQLDPPPGVAPVASHIARNWNHPDFRLGGRFPWISKVDALFRGDSLLELERQQLDIAWQHVCRLAEQYHFTFEAVVLYLIRWEIVYRWTKRNADVGQKKFDLLVAESLGEYAEMFPG